MFNEELKREYIEYKTRNTVLPEGQLERVFRKAERFEEKYEKDISCFTVDEIRYCYKMLNLASTNSLVVINSTLSLYTQWCLEQNLVPDSQNHFLEMSLDAIDSLTNKTVKNASIISKETIYDWIDALENPCDQFILLALYEGISGKQMCELVNLRLSDFNGNKVTLHTGKMAKDADGNEIEVCRTITVSDKLVHLAHQSADEKKYYQRHEEDGDVYYTEIEYLPDEDLILKNYPNVQKGVSAFQLGRRLINKILRIAKIVDAEYLTTTVIITSGKINFIKERCEELKISGEEFLYSDHINEVNKQFDCTLVRSSFYRMYGEHLPT